MYEIECLTLDEDIITGQEEVCAPFYGECYPVGEGCCGPDCNPSY